MIRHRLSKHRDESGPDLRLVITVEGPHDIYRLARALERQKTTEEAGRAVLQAMDRQRPGIVAQLTAALGPAQLVGYRGRRRRPKQLPLLALGMPQHALAELEKAVR